MNKEIVQMWFDVFSIAQIASLLAITVFEVCKILHLEKVPILA